MRDFSGIPQPEIFTLHDLVHRLTLRAALNGSDREKALIVRAIQDAIRGLPAKRDWNYFKRQSRLTTTASFSPTCTYDHTGGAYERLLTITSDHTWPTDASYGEIYITGTPYRIERRISDTVATLESDFTLSEDFAATEVSWERNAYLFSREITTVHHMHNVTNDRVIAYVPTSEFQSVSYTRWGTGVTTHFTWQNRGSRFGSTELILLPSPKNAEVFEVTATVNPHIPKVELFSGEDGVVEAASSTLTSATGGFTTKHIGAIVRVGRSAVEPTYFNGDDWEFQAFVTAVTSTTLTLSEPCTVTGTRGFSISSPADFDSAVMLEHVEDEAYSQYCKNHDHKSFPTARATAMESWRYAAARDNKVSLNGYLWDHGGWWSNWYGGFYTTDEEEDEEE